MAGGSPPVVQGGPSSNNRKRKDTPPSPAAAADDEGEAEVKEEDIKELERELADLDRRVLESRRRMAGRLLDEAASHLAALRPPTGLDVSVVFEHSTAESDREKLEKLKGIESKCNANAIALQKVIERVNGSVAECERLEKLTGNMDEWYFDST